MNSLLLMLPSNETTPPVDKMLDNTTVETTYAVGKWLMKCVEWVLNEVGLEHHETLVTVIYASLVFIIAMFIGRAVQWIVETLLNKIGPHIKSDLYNYLVQERFFSKVCRMIPALVFLILISVTLNAHVALSGWLSRLTWIYILYIICYSLSALTDSIWHHVDSRANKRHLPLNGLIQLVKLIIWLIGIIIVCGVLLDKSPGSLLAGLGAFAAVLMLVFKDSILGVVAGVQLADNDSLHVGDWIAVPGTDANGTVVEVGLTAVKIENWDKTVSTVPPYNLVTNGFKNYRNMSESNTRRICRNYLIDADSVVETTDEMLTRFAQIPLMKDWIEKKMEQKKAGKVENVNNSAGLVDGSIETNLGVFRAYVKMWLDANPDISHADTCFVSTLAQTSAGIPFQVYCFTSTSSWLPYEGIQSAVFEHLAVMLYRFNLYTFEYPTGRDEIIDGFLSPGKNPQDVFGMPYPLFFGSGTPNKPATPPSYLYPGTPAAPSATSGSSDAPGSDPKAPSA